jgi:hypothetical protein
VPERLNAGILVAALGAVALFVSLFLNWWERGISAWTAFELVDVLLAAIAAVAVAAAVAETARRPIAMDRDRLLPALAAAALALVVISIVNNPPATNGFSEDVGAWIALGGAILMVAGAFMAQRRVSIVISSSPRQAAPPQPTEPRGPTGPATDAEGSDTETRPLGPTS